MAHSLEARVPYLDPAVSDLALALPSNMKVRGLSKKRLLRRAARPLIPASILRARKRGFSIPAAAWLRGELKPLAEEVLSPSRIRAQGYFEPAVVSELLQAHCARREDYSRQLWGLISFSLWAEQVTSSTAAAAGLAPVTGDGLEHGHTE
jgi:asparagine synthase (glutamine-hydrolysing)